MVKKTLIFHFYLPNGYKDNVIYKFHIECIKKYINLFDSAIFTISTEDGMNYDSIYDLENELCHLGFKGDLTFKPIENDAYGECNTFKENILDRLDDIDGIVFFGHSKGITRVLKYFEHKDNYDAIDAMKKWIFALYFYSLEFIDEVERYLIKFDDGKRSVFYGPLLTTSRDFSNCFYPGTFYWINPRRLYQESKKGEVEIPKMSSRVFCEEFPSVYKRGYIDYKVASHNMISMYDEINIYYPNVWDSIINFFGESELFYKLYNEINSKL